MEDKFEKFVKDSRHEFDFREPDPKVWKRIKASSGIKRKVNWKVILARAAAIIIIFLASFAVNEIVHRIKNTGGDFTSSDVKNAVPGLKEAETYYSNLVNEKMNELKPILANCPSVEAELNYDMSELDSVYYDLKQDLKDNMANQEVIEAIIENYRLKINILEDLLNEISSLGDECSPDPDAENYAL